MRRLNRIDTRSRSSCILAGMGLLALLLGAPAVGRADIIFSNFGPGFGYDTTGGNPIGNAFDGNNYAQADTFTPTTSANLGAPRGSTWIRAGA